MTISVIINGVEYDLASDMIEVADTFGTEAASALNTFVEKAEESVNSGTVETDEPQTADEWEQFMWDLANRGIAIDLLECLGKYWVGGGKSYFEGYFVEDTLSWQHFTNPDYINKMGGWGCFETKDLSDGRKIRCDKVNFITKGDFVYAYMTDTVGNDYILNFTHKTIHEHAMKLAYDPNWEDWREYIELKIEIA